MKGPTPEPSRVTNTFLLWSQFDADQSSLYRLREPCHPALGAQMRIALVGTL